MDERRSDGTYERRRFARVWSCFTILIVAAFGILVSSVTSTLSAVNISMHETGLGADAGWARTIVPPPQGLRAHIGSVHSWLDIYDKTSSAARSVVVTGPVCFVVSMPVSGRTEAGQGGSGHVLLSWNINDNK